MASQRSVRAVGLCEKAGGEDAGLAVARLRGEGVGALSERLLDAREAERVFMMGCGCCLWFVGLEDGMDGSGEKEMVHGDGGRGRDLCCFPFGVFRCEYAADGESEGR